MPTARKEVVRENPLQSFGPRHHNESPPMAANHGAEPNVKATTSTLPSDDDRNRHQYLDTTPERFHSDARLGKRATAGQCLVPFSRSNVPLQLRRWTMTSSGVSCKRLLGGIDAQRTARSSQIRRGAARKTSLLSAQMLF